MSPLHYVHETAGAGGQPGRHPASHIKTPLCTLMRGSGIVVILYPIWGLLSRTEVTLNPSGCHCMSSHSHVPWDDGQLWCKQTSLGRTNSNLKSSFCFKSDFPLMCLILPRDKKQRKWENRPLLPTAIPTAQQPALHSMLAMYKEKIIKANNSHSPQNKT